MNPDNRRHESPGDPARVDGEASHAYADVRSSAKVEADILSEACRQGAGEPVRIHIRPAVFTRMLAETPTGGQEPRLTRGATRVPLVIDDDIPSAPGYEIHRALPRGRTCST